MWDVPAGGRNFDIHSPAQAEAEVSRKNYYASTWNG
jgi:hypothetical protein